MSLSIARSELILGGQKSGKSRRAELLARHWLDQSPLHHALMLATAQAWDTEMQERIQRHQQDRAIRVPGMTTLEEPRYLAQALQQHSSPETLIVVDCLTLWLTHWLMPAHDASSDTAPLGTWQEQATAFGAALAQAPGPVVLVGNEIGLGVIPLGHEVRAFVDALGLLNQQVAQTCQRVTLMAAGLPLTLKDTPCSGCHAV
ncbi:MULTISPECIES: bifunctional adenosylcobinamide kinase/adenosylcobinamide-phosphate guanylyltransferase [Giesbergeria]|uniref:Bifunctional adenosylcobalamin biosynthesis protein n=1 Tax=Giesbergeria sinuosa TaxID=80883 RepID=A0ABV9QED8_9BURK